MISGHGNIETAVSAIKRGAYDFIEKPFKADRLLLVAERALENSRLRREVRELKQFAPLAATLVGRSPADNQLRQTIEKVAPTNSRVLIVGPSGSGKELAARTIHSPFGARQRSVRRDQCRRDHAGTHGSRTVRRRGRQRHGKPQGRRARGGPWRHAVHRRDRRHAARDAEQDLAGPGRPDFQRVGGSTKVTVDVRIVSSTSRNIEADIAAGKFREDLYHRLSVVPIGCRRWPSGGRIFRNWLNIS